ncbi:mCG147156 [Mus musculus]|jgi:hypothetical protein|nr:mCG147156 [Mus musculus]
MCDAFAECKIRGIYYQRNWVSRGDESMDLIDVQLKITLRMLKKRMQTVHFDIYFLIALTVFSLLDWVVWTNASTTSFLRPKA